MGQKRAKTSTVPCDLKLKIHTRDTHMDRKWCPETAKELNEGNTMKTKKKTKRKGVSDRVKSRT